MTAVHRTRLATTLADLRTVTAVLVTSVAEDRPETTGDRARHKVVEDLVLAVRDLDDVVAGALVAIGGRDGPGAVLTSHRALAEAADIMRSRVVGVDAGVHVTCRVCRRWGRRWESWAAVVQDGARDVTAALAAAEQALCSTVAHLLGPDIVREEAPAS